jgi:hypothetical protein
MTALVVDGPRTILVVLVASLDLLLTRSGRGALRKSPPTYNPTYNKVTSNWSGEHG